MGKQETTTTERGKITLFSEVANELYEECILELVEYERKGIPVDMYISTDGGDPIAALCLCDILDRIRTEVNIYLWGEVLSAGIFIAMGGYNNPNVTVYAYPSTIGLIHWGAGQLEMCEIGLMHDYTDFHANYILPLMKQYVLKHTAWSEEDVEQFERRDVWLSAQDLLKYGIVDVIL